MSVFVNQEVHTNLLCLKNLRINGVEQINYSVGERWFS